MTEWRFVFCLDCRNCGVVMTAAYADRTQNYLQRILSLEVELFDAARSGQMSTADFNKRQARLEQLKAQFEKIEQLLMNHESRVDMTTEGDFELPVMNDCSRLEQNIVSGYVEETHAVITDLAKKSALLLEWSKEAASGETYWIKTALRLSKIRAKMTWMQHRLDAVRKMRKTLETFILKVSPQAPGASPSNGKTSLVDAFRDFETTMARIGRLRLKLRSERTKNVDMEQWLKRYEERRRAVSPTMKPPAVEEVVEASDEVMQYIVGGSLKANERLVIATRLAKTLDGAADFGARYATKSDGAENPEKSNENQSVTGLVVASEILAETISPRNKSGDRR